MTGSVPLERLLKRDRLIIVLGIGGLSLLAWGYMIGEARGMSLTGVCCCAGMKMSGPDVTAWSIGALVPLFLMWAEMMVAMMLPSAAPMILTFAMVNRQRSERQEPFVPASVFVLGYLLTWTTFSLLAAIGQWVLHASALLSPGMVSTSPILGGGLLILAGLFQWTRLKNACLAHCRSPLTFLMAEWREGKAGALRMGIKHGVYCTGCCWILMLLLFVAGVMNMWWIAAITVLVLIEKALRQGPWLGKLAGIVLVVWGFWMILSAF